MKKILYVFHCSTIGGGSYCLLNILKNLDRNKYIPTVLLAYNGPLVDEIEKLGIDVFFYPELDSTPNIVLNNFEKIKKEVGTKERKLLP